MFRFLIFAPLIGLIGCPTPATETPDEADADTDADTDTDSDTDTDVDSCDQPLACEAGVGFDGYNALTADGAIEMVHGPQGGWHVDTAVLALRSTQVVRVLPKVRVVSTGELLAGADGLQDTYNQALVLNGPCSGTAWQMRAVFDEIDIDLDTVCALEDEALEIEIELTDTSGNTTICTATGIATLDPNDVEPCSAP